MPKGNIPGKPSPSGSGLPFRIHGAFFLDVVRGVFGDSLCQLKTEDERFCERRGSNGVLDEGDDMDLSNDSGNRGASSSWFRVVGSSIRSKLLLGMFVVAVIPLMVLVAAVYFSAEQEIGRAHV